MCVFGAVLENPAGSAEYFVKYRRKGSREEGCNGGGKKEKSLVERRKEWQFPGGLGSQMDWKECLECENLRRTHTLPETVSSFVLWSCQGDMLPGQSLQKTAPELAARHSESKIVMISIFSVCFVNINFNIFTYVRRIK